MAIIANRYAIELAGQCARPLCFASQGDEFYGLAMIEITQTREPTDRIIQLGIQGSCTLFEYSDAYYVAFTRHQIMGAVGATLEEFYENLGLLYVLLDDGVNGLNLPISSVLLPPMIPQIEDHHDFVIACVERTMMTPFMRSLFFPVVRGDMAVVGNDVVCGGYPMHRQELLMETRGQRTNLASLKGEVQRREQYEQGVMAYETPEEHVDGFSGGAVIVCQISPYRNLVAFIDGIIQRGGNGIIRYIGMEHIIDKIDGR